MNFAEQRKAQAAAVRATSNQPLPKDTRMKAGKPNYVGEKGKRIETQAPDQGAMNMDAAQIARSKQRTKK